jgi:NAD(P)-dependent dehydrogenase (short-subunit alcohol dehydrogenase family)
VTGANRGIGKALVEEALKRGAKQVYAGTRQPLTHSDERVTPLTLDVTDAAQIQAAVAQIGSLDILINNAGITAYDDGLGDPAVLDQMMAVNYHAVRDVTQAFLPKLTESGGAVVNNVSVNAFAPLALIASYSVSKAAVFNLTQSLRVILANKGVSVHAIMTGIADTDMTAGVDVPKSTAQAVAEGVFDGIENGEEEIFPDQMSAPMADAWRNGPGKGLEKAYGEMYVQFTQQAPQ